MDYYKIDPDDLLNAYAQGIFPMSDDADDPDIFWVKPKMRGIIPLNSLHISRSLAKFLRKNPFEIRFDTDFLGVINGCAEAKQGRENTWINQPIRDACHTLFLSGFCHTVEAWRDNHLVGGLYGISLGGAFFGESMFSRADNASKACLVALVNLLQTHDFQLLDTQFLTDHLASMGAIEISQEEYEKLLFAAIKVKAKF
ncbi:leucyl/phenylalanyl-tRNA--protein transferase [Bartonella sp. HY329]|uniref:leucyl/phenylalanyl-tRNA--protein transferase n=1 Tax=unclassified Bartonella TaxID=2645622 RepID=UPI0021C9D260|nr:MULTISPECIES: leucyl/phenylalanyl-tRNA--protein transferase [unclassified Bartonella]UXM94087.1 leucyl/phenylalanyl-tRNA--protein transferase [Bartonella sp. HY329]UXN08409.1 leucyl/phenylalanyl-tRNA--protein transferase [Bartonella sp. HY328]